MEEIWKDVPQYEGLYKVSNLGRVHGIVRGKIKATRDNGRGYQQVDLWKDNKGKSYYVHRLVALAFIPNPGNLPQVNHKDENKANNCVDNLEWCDNDYNNAYGSKRARQYETLLNNGKICYKVSQYTLDGKYVATYRSIREAARMNGISPSCIFQYFRENYSQCGGYRWVKEENTVNRF